MKRRHRVAPRREEAAVDERRAQHRQLQARDLARHLGGTPRVGKDLVEQAADDLDHQMVELAARGLLQLDAVGADQVRRHQAREPARRRLHVRNAERHAGSRRRREVVGRGHRCTSRSRCRAAGRRTCPGRSRRR
jgi:hypothetical protein